MKMRKIPMRSCVVTRERCEKKDLIRIVRTPEKEIKIDLVGEENAKFAMNWLDDFAHDYDLILDNPSHKSADIRSANIGKDKKGNVICFDWFDPYC